MHPIALGDHERDLQDIDGIEAQTFAVERRIGIDGGRTQLEIERLDDQLGKLARERISIGRAWLAHS